MEKARKSTPRTLPRRSPPDKKSQSDLKKELKEGLEIKAAEDFFRDLEKKHRRAYNRDAFHKAITDLIDDPLCNIDEDNLYSIRHILKPRLSTLYKIIYYYENIYWRAFDLDKGFPWQPWIEDPEIQRAIGKTRIRDCMNYAWDHKGPEKASIELAEAKGIKQPETSTKTRTGKEFPHHWGLKQFDFDAMAEELSRIKTISDKEARKTIKAITDATIFENMGRIGPHGKTIYKIGIWKRFWHPEERRIGLRLRPLLTKEKHFEILKDFKIKGK